MCSYVVCCGSVMLCGDVVVWGREGRVGIRGDEVWVKMWEWRRGTDRACRSGVYIKGVSM